MLTKFQILTTFALVYCALQPSVGSDINAALHHINNGQFTQLQTIDIDEFVKEAYNNDFDNFYKVIEFTLYTRDPNEKADIICALYYAMVGANHTEDPLRALPLYDEIENLININGGNITTDRLGELESMRGILLWKTIVPIGAGILQAAVYLHTCDHMNTAVGQLFDLLYATNLTVSELTVTQMVSLIGRTLPIEERISILPDLSVHVRINVDAMLALYNEGQIKDEVEMDFYMNLGRLQLNPQFNATVLKEKQRQVEAIFPKTLQILFGGYVCLHQKMNNGSIFYLRECRNSPRACVYIAQEIGEREVFIVEATKKGINFRYQYYSNLLSIQPGESLQSGGYKLNIYSSSSGDFDWKINMKGDDIILSNMNETMILCAGTTRAMGSNNEWFAYTRDPEYYVQYQNECKWTVDDCKDV